MQGSVRMYSIHSLAALLLAALAATACTDTWDPPSLVNKVRLLGIRADPAYIPAAGPTTLEVLSVGQAAGSTLCYSWAFCPFAWSKDGSFACIDPLVQVDLGSAATATVTPDIVMASLTQAPAVFKKLGMAQPGASASGSSTPKDMPEFYVLLKVATVDASGGTCPTDSAKALAKPCTDSTRCLAGFKRLAWALTPDKINANPTLHGLNLDGVPWPADLTPTAAAGDLLDLKPSLDLADKEVTGSSVDPKLGNQTETLLMSWFTTAGLYDKERTLDTAPANVLQLPSLGAGQSEKLVTIWVVLRDGRNGEDWTSRQLLIKPGVSAKTHPLCAANPSLAGCDHLDASGKVSASK